MTKNRKISITSLALISAASLAAAAAITGGALTAEADRTVTLTGSNYFYTAGQASIEEETVGENYYTAFQFASDSSTVTYRKNLAYHWFASAREDGNPTGVPEEGFLSTEIGFPELNFETFTIKFQSQQYTQTKDDVTDNYVTFIARGESVYVKIGEALPEDATERADAIEEVVSAQDAVALSPESITISFTDYAGGVYSVAVTNDTESMTSANTVYGKFENVGGSYASYVSSTSSTSVTPLTYSAQFAEGAEEPVTMVLYSFNNQSFELVTTEGSDARRINDNTPPVLCLDEDITTLDYGRTIDIDYTVIDMLATSPRSTLNYYVLTKAQRELGNLNYTGDGEEDGTDATNNFIEVASGDDAPVIKGADTYKPGAADNGPDYTTQCLVKVYFTIKDSTASNGNSDDVFLEWYIPSEYLSTVTAGAANDEEYKFIRATADNLGATYSPAADAAEGENGFEGYQQLVEEALAEQKASAGDGNYFYLPSFEEYIRDNVTSYRDLTFSIYYIGSDSGSSTSLAYNELSIEIEDDGLYRFAIYATDAAENQMYYIERDEDGNEVMDENGEPVIVKFAASDLASLLEDPAKSKLVDYVPVFEFTVNYGGLTVTDPEGQDIGFVGTKYSADSFDITGLSSNYSTTYSLYVFDRRAYTEDTGKTISYAQLIKGLSSSLAEDENFFRAYRQYFTLIPALDDLDETEEDYDLYSAYEWDSSALTFIPQEADANSFYVIRLEAEDSTYLTDPIVSYMAISVSAAADPVYGEDTWVQDNVASIVLLSIAGVALIGIVLLIVIKPKEKGDIDVIDEAEVKRVSARKKVSK